MQHHRQVVVRFEVRHPVAALMSKGERSLGEGYAVGSPALLLWVAAYLALLELLQLDLDLRHQRTWQLLSKLVLAA